MPIQVCHPIPEGFTFQIYFLVFLFCKQMIDEIMQHLKFQKTAWYSNLLWVRCMINLLYRINTSSCFLCYGERTLKESN